MAQEEDDFDRYINAKPNIVDWKEQNLYQWWDSCDYPSLRQWAWDTLSIPAMSTELERVFSQAKRTITSDRNRLAPATFEALQCLKYWIDRGHYDIGTD